MGLAGFASQRSTLFGLLAILIPLLLVGRLAQAAPIRRAVGVDLVASWDATPLHLEASYPYPRPLAIYSMLVSLTP